MVTLPGLPEMSPALLAVLAGTLLMFVVSLAFLGAAWRLRRLNRRKARVWGRLELHLGQAVERISRGDEGALKQFRRTGASHPALVLDYLYKRLVLERRPERRELYRTLAQPWLPLLERRARDGDVWQRARAVRTIAELAGADAAATIRAALDDPAPHVAGTAARAYARLRLGPVDELLSRIERYRQWDRRLLRSVLVRFGEPAVPSLHVLLADRARPAWARAAVADALAVLAGDGVGDTAAAVLREEAEAVLREERDVDLVAACLRLIRAPATPAQRQVVRDLCASPDDVIRGQAVSCLARIGEDADVDQLERSLTDASPWVARNAELALAARAGGRG